MMDTTKLTRFDNGDRDPKMYFGVLARVESTTLGFNDRGCMVAMLNVDYGGVVQSVGVFRLGDGSQPAHDLMPTKSGAEFIMRILEVFGPYQQWERLKGKMLYVLFTGEDFVNPDEKRLTLVQDAERFKLFRIKK